MLAARDAKFRVKLDASLPLAPTAVAMGFNSLFEGVRLTMLSSPGDLPSEDAESVLSLFVDSLMHLARLQSQCEGRVNQRSLPARDDADLLKPVHCLKSRSCNCQ
jgi:hypothetical protein